MKLTADFEVVRKLYQELSTIVELPCIEVGTRLQFVTRVLVVETTIECYLEPIVTIAHGYTLVEIGGSCGVLGSIGLLLRHVTYKVVVTYTGIGTHIPMCCRIERGIKGQTCVNVPIAIDILGLSDATTGFWIIAHQIRDRVADVAVVGINHNTTFVSHNVVVVIGIERAGELRFQSRITLGDVKRVRIVGDVEQLRHIRLTCIAAIVNPQVTLIAELIVEIECWREVSDITHCVDIDATIILNEI